MKTGEMIDALYSNNKFKAKVVNDERVTGTVMVDESGRIVWEIGYEVVRLHELFKDWEWEIIKPEPKPVDFITAVKAYAEGKTIRCEIEGKRPKIYRPEFNKSSVINGLWFISDGDVTLHTGQILEGVWYIED